MGTQVAHVLVYELLHCELEKHTKKFLSHLKRNPADPDTSSSAMAERPRELDQRFQMGSQFEAIID